MTALPVDALPNWAEQLTAWSTCVLAAGVVLAVVAAWLSRRAIREAVNSRHAQIALDVTNRWNDDTMREVKRSLIGISKEDLLGRIAKGQVDNSDDFYELERFANYFENLGTLFKLGALEIEWIEEMLGSSVINYWDLWEPSVLRDRPVWPKLYENWQAMANELRRRRDLRRLWPVIGQ
jgi:hypothetical protein